jgi:hypothetical protein
VRELDAEFRCRELLCFANKPSERFLLLIRIEAEATMRAPADLRDGRCLHDHQAGAGHHEIADMNEMPRPSHAFDGAVLAHRRDPNAVVELEAADPPGPEECAHGCRPARFSVAAP